MNKTYNFYCDESTHLENDKMPFMILGYVSVPYNQIKIHKESIQAIKKKHGFFGEIKWSKVSHSQSTFYLELIDYFFSSDLCFRGIVIKKDQINHDRFCQDHELFYYKMYYQLIHHKLDMSNSYNIYLDIKDELSAKKVRKLKEILQSQYGIIRNLQNIRSHESLYMQLADLIMGAINYHLRNENKVIAKNQLIKRIQNHSHSLLNCSTSLKEEKLNLFFIELQ